MSKPAKRSVDSTLSSLINSETKSKSILSKNQQLLDEKRRKIKNEIKLMNAAKREKKLLKNLCHIKCDYSTAEFDNRMLKIATKGVVTLFNAVTKQQKAMEDAAEEEAPSKKQKIGKKSEQANTWSVLGDAYNQTPNEFRDWDKDSESGGDN